MKWNKRTMVYVAVGLSVLGALIAGYFLIQTTLATPTDWQVDQKQVAEVSLVKETDTSKERTGSTKNKELPVTQSAQELDLKDQITVDIKGAVNKPGVYVLPKDARMHHLIAQAGGFKEQAEANQVNLAAILVDQQMIYVSAKGELPIVPVVPTSTTSADLTSESVMGQATQADTKKININQANLTELQELKGIGIKKAQAIIDYRTKNGAFSSIDQLSEVDGFGQKTVENLRESITI